jgi:signal transduction histidine kinase
VDEPHETILVQADLTRLSQVLANLLNNAARCSPRGSVIELGIEAGPEQVTIRVRDNGIGIGAAMLPQIFELFTRADNSLEKRQGGRHKPRPRRFRSCVLVTTSWTPGSPPAWRGLVAT